MEIYSSKLDFLSPVKVDTSHAECDYIPINPNTSLMDNSPVSFCVPSMPGKYVDFGETKLRLKIRILKNNDEELTSTDDVTFVNNALFSCIRCCEIYANQKLVYTVGPNEAYKHIFDIYLNSGNKTVYTDLESQLFKIENADLSANASLGEDRSNESFIWRNKLTRLSKTLDLEGYLGCDLGEQSRVFLDNIQWTIKIWPSSPQFALLSQDSSTNFKVKIIDATLKLATITVNPEMYLGQIEALKHSPARYLLQKSDIRVYSLAAGISTFNLEDLYQSKIPNRLVCALISNEGYYGDITKNPFEFPHCNLAELIFSVNGRNRPTHGMQLDYTNNIYMDGYNSLHTDLKTCFIGRDLYKAGYSIYQIDLTTYSSDYAAHSKTGHTRLSLRFDKPLETSNVLIIYAKFPTIMEIDYNREVSMY